MHWLDCELTVTGFDIHILQTLNHVFLPHTSADHFKDDKKLLFDRKCQFKSIV